MKRYIILPAIALYCLTSCSDFLDQDPLDSFTEVAVWEDPALAESYLNEQYTHLFSEFQKGVMYANFSDEAYHMHGYGTTVVTQGLLSPDSPNLAWNDDMYNNPWNLNYGYIKDINLFMEKIDQIPAKTEEEIDWRQEMKGQGYFLRAWFYSELYRHYGSVPLITHTYGLHDDFFNTVREPMDKVAEYITSQCDSASNLLPTRYSDAKDFGRATKGAALALKARTLLYAASPLFGTPSSEKWEKAAAANKAVIELKDESGAEVYHLAQANSAEEYADMFVDKMNPEVILMKMFDKQGQGIGNDSFTHQAPAGPGSGFEGWSTIQPSQKVVDAFQNADGTDYVRTSDTENPYKDREWRFYAAVFYDGATWGYGESKREVQMYVSGEEGVTGGLDSNEGPNWWNGTQTGYNMRKFLDKNFDTYGTESNNTPWFFFRLSEFYLNYAECLIELGKTGEALKYINDIRARVNLPATTADNLKEKYKHERMVELVFEGHRWFDLRRWKEAETVLNEDIYGIKILKFKDGSKKYELKTDPCQVRTFIAPQNYWLPIPREELRKAPQLDPTPYN